MMIILWICILLIKFSLQEDLNKISGPPAESTLCKCDDTGLSSERVKVINGVPVRFNDLRYLGVLYRKTKKFASNEYEYVNICSGVVLNNVTFLTAAHCLDIIEEIKDGDFFVAAGASHDFYKYLQYKSLRAPVLKIFKHPKYEKKSGLSDHDIGLVKLFPPLELGSSNNIYSACLLNEKFELFNGTLITGGYGPKSDDHMKDEKRKFSKKAKPIIHGSLQLTYANLTQVKGNCKVLNGICAYSRTPSICGANHGAPLLLKSKNRLYMIGIAKEAIAQQKKLSCAPGRIIAFTSVYPYFDFIRSHTNDQLCLSRAFAKTFDKEIPMMKSKSSFIDYKILLIFLGLMFSVTIANYVYLRLRTLACGEILFTQTVQKVTNISIDYGQSGILSKHTDKKVFFAE